MRLDDRFYIQIQETFQAGGTLLGHPVFSGYPE